MQTKKEIRREANARVLALGDNFMSLSEKAAQRAYEYLSTLLTESDLKLGLFLSIKGREIDTDPLISLLRQDEHHPDLLVPRVEDETTIRFFRYDERAPHKISKYGIWEPLAPSSEALVPDVIVVPGVAFDVRGGRVGHGKGYYDRYFALHSDVIRRKVALSFEVQVFPEVPMDDFDHPMDLLITDTMVRLF